MKDQKKKSHNVGNTKIEITFRGRRQEFEVVNKRMARVTREPKMHRLNLTNTGPKKSMTRVIVSMGEKAFSYDLVGRGSSVALPVPAVVAGPVVVSVFALRLAEDVLLDDVQLTPGRSMVSITGRAGVSVQSFVIKDAKPSHFTMVVDAVKPE